MPMTKTIFTGLLAGLVAALVMTGLMLFLWSIGVGTPLAIIGDRLSVFISPGPFLALMGKVGGYNHLKQLGIGSTLAGQLAVGALGGAFYALSLRAARRRVSLLIFVLLPAMVAAAALWPVLGTSYLGWPIAAARFVTLIGFILCVLIYESILVGGFRFLVRAPSPEGEETGAEFSPLIGRRALLLGSLGLIAAGGGAALLRKLWRVATFSYDGLQYKGRDVQPITPNDLFYCVTKNVVDPRVDGSFWHLEVTGLVQSPRAYSLTDVMGLPAVEQETTLMCISNGLDGGLISNAAWKGVPLRDFITLAAPLARAARVKLHGVDNYTDTIPYEKAMDPATLVAHTMNGQPLPHRHGFPARVIVPGYFGEKHVKWLTRIELATAAARGFYETQGWGPDFVVPTRSRIDVPDNFSEFSISQLTGPIEVKGMAYGGDRGISKVELSFDGGKKWEEADVYYAGGDLAWSLWSSHDGWMPEQPGYYTVFVRATDGKGKVQDWEARPAYSGTAGLHSIGVNVKA